MRGRTVIIQGGQWGSEGKGQVAAAICGEEGIGHAVRTGSINAGHTVYHLGQKCSMQIIPTAWVHPGVQLYLGAGTYIEPEVLDREVNLIRALTQEDIRQRLWIDERCAWFGDEQRATSEKANRHHSMGATGKGCSEAIVSKMRDRGEPEAHRRLFMNSGDRARGYNFVDTAQILNDALEGGEDVLLEGTQGAMLDFNLGPYPYVTSRMTNAAAWLAEAGLPPVNVDTVLVLRSHPIRVAGNSGPMPQETSWLHLFRHMNAKLRSGSGGEEIVSEDAMAKFERVLNGVIDHDFPEVRALLQGMAHQFQWWTESQRQLHRVCLSEANARAFALLDPATTEALRLFEKTTVTKKLRRVANFSLREARYAIAMNAPRRIVYTFINYDVPELWNETSVGEVLALNEGSVFRFVEDMSHQLGAPITHVSTGPLQPHVLNLSQR